MWKRPCLLRLGHVEECSLEYVKAKVLLWTFNQPAAAEKILYKMNVPTYSACSAPTDTDRIVRSLEEFTMKSKLGTRNIVQHIGSSYQAHLAQLDDNLEAWSYA